MVGCAVAEACPGGRWHGAPAHTHTHTGVVAAPRAEVELDVGPEDIVVGPQRACWSGVGGSSAASSNVG
jgi:hypothetical protein